MQQSMPMPMAPQQQAQRLNAPMLVPMQAPPFTPDGRLRLDYMDKYRAARATKPPQPVAPEKADETE